MTINEYLRFNGYYEDANEYLALNIIPKERIIIKRPMVLCADGYTISVQANFCAYCKPRTTLWPENWGDGYTHVELGYPSVKDDLIIEYAEDYDKPTNTVYGYVPIEVVEELIKKHGGIVNQNNIKEK